MELAELDGRLDCRRAAQAAQANSRHAHPARVSGNGLASGATCRVLPTAKTIFVLKLCNLDEREADVPEHIADVFQALHEVLSLASKEQSQLCRPRRASRTAVPMYWDYEVRDIQDLVLASSHLPCSVSQLDLKLHHLVVLLLQAQTQGRLLSAKSAKARATSAIHRTVP